MGKGLDEEGLDDEGDPDGGDRRPWTKEEDVQVTTTVTCRRNFP
jgi:hypothetical protein